MDYNENDFEFTPPPQQKPKKKKSGLAIVILIIIIAVLFSRLFSLAQTLGFGEEFIGAAVFKTPPEEADNESASETVTDIHSDFRETLHFSEMEYTRPDTDAFLSKIEAIEDSCFTLSCREIIPLLDEVYDDYSHFNTMYMLATIKSSADVTDEYYYNECIFLGDQSPVIDQKLEVMLFALAASPISDELEAEYYGTGYLTDYTGTSTYSDELVALYQEESRLIIEYQTIMGAAAVEMYGETVDVDTYLYENMDNTYNYYTCLEKYYEKYSVLCGEIYTDLVLLRHEIAQERGFDSYIDYSYDYYERDYTAEEIRDYLDTVCLGVAPLYLELYESGELFDYSMTGTLSSGDNFAALRSAVNAMGGEISDIFAFMEQYGLYDISSSSTKENLSYQSYFDEWDAPFLTLNAMGTLDDYLSFAHEFGHFAEAYLNRNLYANTDISEGCSQAMEFLAMLNASALGQDADTVTHMKMVDLVALYAEQGAYNAFEEAIYAIPPEELDPERITETAHDIFIEYGLLTENDHEMYDHVWIDIAHFFSNPFYIVSYIISNDAAFQIYELELETPGSGVEAFLDMAQRDRLMYYTANLRNCGLDPSLSPVHAQRIADILYDYFE